MDMAVGVFSRAVSVCVFVFMFVFNPCVSLCVSISVCIVCRLEVSGGGVRGERM